MFSLTLRNQIFVLIRQWHIVEFNNPMDNFEALFRR